MKISGNCWPRKPVIDAVIVGTPDHQHAQVAVKAMEKGKHVFCQKPMTNAVYEARLMAETATKTRTGNPGGHRAMLLMQM